MNAKKGLAFVTTSSTDATVDAVLLGGKQGSGPAVQRAKSRRWATTVWLN